MASARLLGGAGVGIIEAHSAVAATTGKARPVRRKADMQHCIRVSCGSSGDSSGVSESEFQKRGGEWVCRFGPGTVSVHRVTGTTRKVDRGWYRMGSTVSVDTPCTRGDSQAERG